MKISRSTDPFSKLIAKIEPSDENSNELPVYLVDRRKVTGVESMIIEVGELRLTVKETENLIDRLNKAIEIAWREAPRRFPYTRPGEQNESNS